MTINELMQWLEQFQGVIALWLVALPVLTYSFGALLQKGSRLLARYLLAAAIYLAVIPGICTAVILLYMLLFVRVNLLREMHLVLHLLPVVSMVATLWAASRLEDFEHIPGFDRIQGLMILVGLSFAGLLFVHRMFVGLVFFARFEHLLLLLGGFLVVWRLGVARFLKKRHNTPASR
jgi:hypothetical protein